MRAYLIGVAGCSGSGKSALSGRVAGSIGGACLLSLDSYYHPLDQLPLEERARRNFDHPDALDWDLLVRQLSELRSGKPVEEPVYLFAEHTRAPHTRRRQSVRCVVVEGILALHHPAVRGLLDLAVFVETPDEVCLRRRIERDIKERGRTEESVRRQYTATVRPMAEQFVLPSKRWAHLVVDGSGPLSASVDAVVRAYSAGSSSAASPNL